MKICLDNDSINQRDKNGDKPEYKGCENAETSQEKGILIFMRVPLFSSDSIHKRGVSILRALLFEKASLNVTGELST